MNDRASARKNRIFASKDIDGKKSNRAGAGAGNCDTQGDAKFTRILVGYSTGETIFVSMAAEARESRAVSPMRARPVVRMEMVYRQAPAELQERLALRE